MKNSRTESLLKLRPTLPLVISEDSNAIEIFMHTKLRPILKYQNDWIMQMISSAQHFKHLKFDNWDAAKNRTTVANFLAKNKNIRHQLLGGISAMLTSEELTIYLNHNAEFNKRIVEMIVTRFISNYVAAQ